MCVSGSKGPAHYYNYHHHGEREKNRRRQEDEETTTTGVATASVCHRMCDYHYFHLEEKRQTMTTGEMTAQREGSHYNTTTRMTAMTTIMQDRLQERSDDKREAMTSLDFVIRLLTDGLLLLLAFFSHFHGR